MKTIRSKTLLLACFLTVGASLTRAQQSATDPAAKSQTAPVVSATQAANPIVWMSMEAALEKCKIAPKKILVDVFTEWCGWCKRMDASTFQDPIIAQVINQYYYAVKFDAEQKTDLTFKGTVYHFVPNASRGYHQLASALLGGQMSYPSFAFLDEELNLIQSMAGFQQPVQFDPILNYFGADYYKTVPWENFVSTYKSPLGN